MTRPVVGARRVVSRTPRKIGLSIRLICLAGGMLLSAATAWGAMVPTTAGPTFGIDDNNTSMLNPSPLIAVSTIVQCPWINTGLDAFEASPAGAGWSHTWATPAEMAKVEAGISILDYYAWVVSEPTVTAGNGDVYGVEPALAGNGNVHDVGGAVFNIKYTPMAGAHVFTDLHWVQGLRAHYDTYADGEYQVRLDAAGATPFYDSGGAAGTLPGGGGYFLDTPWKIENEAAEKNPVADVQFQVVLADYNSTTKVVTLYGGEWWGYNYTAVDVPEPSTLVLFVLGAMGLVGCWRVREKRSDRCRGYRRDRR